MRILAKYLFLGMGVLIVSPLIVVTWLEKVLWQSRSERAFGWCKEILALWPTFVGEYMRLGFYWASCTSIATDVCFMLGSMVAHRDTTIGERVVIGVWSIIGQANIGNDVLIGARVSLLSGKHQHGRPDERITNGNTGPAYEQITIGEHSFIGQEAIIMANVGRNCTIGAGAVLLRDAQDFATMLGNPARKVSMSTATNNPPSAKL